MSLWNNINVALVSGSDFKANRYAGKNNSFWNTFISYRIHLHPIPISLHYVGKRNSRMFYGLQFQEISKVQKYTKEGTT
uniref:Uncharacterized protein n=1 Tax=Arundo donax TaxID=35708 RepID=A0A0A8YV45_ARUDO